MAKLEHDVFIRKHSLRFLKQLAHFCLVEEFADLSPCLHIAWLRDADQVVEFGEAYPSSSTSDLSAQSHSDPYFMTASSKSL
jgi:hypothetical protein